MAIGQCVVCVKSPSDVDLFSFAFEASDASIHTPWTSFHELFDKSAHVWNSASASAPESIDHLPRLSLPRRGVAPGVSSLPWLLRISLTTGAQEKGTVGSGACACPSRWMDRGGSWTRSQGPWTSPNGPWTLPQWRTGLDRVF